MTRTTTISGQSTRRTLCAALALVASALVSPQASAQAWPQRPVTFIVPFAAGTATDVMARFIAENLTKSHGMTVVIDNRPGASASIGASAVARAASDGYTILVGSSTTHAANAALFTKLSYDPVKDFKPITLLGYVPQVMMVNAQSPIRTIDEFIAHAKTNRGKINYAQGSSGNLLPAEILNRRKDLGMTMVSYKSPPQAMQDLLGNQVDMMFGDLSVSIANIQGNKLRPLAVTSKAPHPLLPNVAPLANTIEGFELTTWMAMFAPAGTPDQIVGRLRSAVHAALADPATATRISDAGMRVQVSTGPELGAYVESETRKWAGYVKEAQVQPQ
ncbi:Bug family tripartite tricarboxylate transporter substrate binding protein [Ottowia thiooxydans]|uniref:Bug family tripartite tricarboxylate transporter substrate binding protein n=1 Tax=Ottowia thiooxydans TaxID=219182 RepID=UPI000406B70D|nr:tripartite tricarboxylate transporter substrate binding protein [Ottowia thiooxydans]